MVLMRSFVGRSTYLKALVCTSAASELSVVSIFQSGSVLFIHIFLERLYALNFKNMIIKRFTDQGYLIYVTSS